MADGRPEYLIETTSMVKSYGNLQALDSMDLRVPYGAIGLLGPNGAGKSTLIKCLLGLVTPTKGKATVLGLDTSQVNTAIEIRQRIGYMPENDCLIPSLDAVEHVKYMAELSGLLPMDAIQRAHEVLDYVGIMEERYRKVKTYSTGMKQKVKLAQSVVHDPELIFLDEPTNGMDPQGRDEMLELVKDISTNHGINVIFSSHLLPDVEYICKYVVIMQGGRLVIQGSMDELTGSTGRIEIKIKGDRKIFEKVLKKLKLKYEMSGVYYYVQGGDDLIFTLYKELDGTGIQLRHATGAKRTLEDIFVSNIGAGGKT